MQSRFLVRFVELIAGVAIASSAHAGLIEFKIDSVDLSTAGVTLGSTVTVSQNQETTDLLGKSFWLGAGGSKTKTFDFLDVTVSGTGTVAGLIDASLNFGKPITTSADGVLGGFAVILGFGSGGVLTVLNDPGPIAFGDGGLFDVDFFGFSSTCVGLKCDSLTGTVTAQVSLLRAPTTSVPEPATLSLLGAGLVALGLRRRRRTQN